MHHRYRRYLDDASKSPEAQKITTKLLELNEFFEKNGIDALKKYLLFAGMGIFNVLSVHVEYFL